MEDFLLTFNDYQILKFALLLIAFGICLPTFDTYTDVGLSYSFFNGTDCNWKRRWVCPDNRTNCYLSERRYWGDAEWVCNRYENDQIYGTLILVPILLATIFTSFHWWKKENTTRKRLLTLPLLLCQLWPQWQVIKLLRMMKRRDGHWKAEREKLQKEVGPLGNT